MRVIFALGPILGMKANHSVRRAFVDKQQKRWKRKRQNGEQWRWNKHNINETKDATTIGGDWKRPETLTSEFAYPLKKEMKENSGEATKKRQENESPNEAREVSRGGSRGMEKRQEEGQ